MISEPKSRFKKKTQRKKNLDGKGLAGKISKSPDLSISSTDHLRRPTGFSSHRFLFGKNVNIFKEASRIRDKIRRKIVCF
jgi:hypothetical protein